MTGGRATNGEFFAIDSRIWAKVAVNGIGPESAYLVVACGTGRDNRSSSWSTSALMKHGGMGWERAKNAIDLLTQKGFIRHAQSSTPDRPRYELATYREVLESELARNPPAVPDYREQRVLAELEAGRQPTNKAARNRAENLCKHGLLVRDAQGRYGLPKPDTGESGDTLLWIPNTIATGTSEGEESPVKRLRSAGCAWSLRLLVDLYAAQNLRDDGGISPFVLWQDFDRIKVGEQGAYTVWGFKEKTAMHRWAGPFLAQKTRPKLEKGDSSAWPSLNLLIRMGLLSFVPHIFENDTPDAEPIHVYGIGGTAEEPLEQQIGSAANEAGIAMCLPSKLAEAEENGFNHFCPVLSTNPTARMIGVARLTYRPHTRRTGAWSADLHQTGPIWIREYQMLTQKANEIAARMIQKYACT